MINGKKVLAITLARGGSKGIFKKNITPILGKPLIEYTVEEVKKSKYVDEYIIGTDDSEIKKISQKLDVIVFDRKIVSDYQTSAEGLLEVIEFYNSYDYIVEVMCTNPLKSVLDLDRVIELLDSNEGSSVTSVTQVIDNHPTRLKYIVNGKLQGFDKNENPDKPGFRRQDLTPKAYVRNGSFYAMRRNNLVKDKSRLNNNIIPYIMDLNRSVNIDEPIDLLIAKILLQNEN